jgi:hypothetical protein
MVLSCAERRTAQPQYGRDRRLQEDNRYVQRKGVAEQLLNLWVLPHWIAVANIEALAVAVNTIYRQFSSLPKDFSGDELIAQIWKDQKKRRRR